MSLSLNARASVRAIPGLWGRPRGVLGWTVKLGVLVPLDVKVDCLGVAGSASKDATPAGIWDDGMGESSIVVSEGSRGTGEAIGRAC